ncbi:Bardet-Biedl syndrome 2 protein homolog isoform X2 [Eurytemora carolleeae]|uniref:Bardet-Biedl syndrome 2 protein homolog isoform X2 n=1 Tax=Eurytemora carolleeae TaxID=1294199 RepID=UPI000C76D6F3|nr:Bardet-Biedl syndrome 2 protein homolog isoform X2 [Eurytemora carolleeae]|eukprot:XP_023337045.1 Bardet-Biedl syndrome 2 protein homolog isoform X2 [Eurytemora affinis]
MLLPVFTLNFNQKMLVGRVCIGEYDGEHPCLTAATTAEKVGWEGIGEYDGEHPCLTAATTAEKVLIHNPHQRLGLQAGRLVANQANQDLSMLNINQRILSLAAGRLNPTLNRDILLVGSPTNLLAYDVENNSDIFYKEVADGANAVQIGYIGDRERPLAVVGGNCSLQGFDFEGNDPFWTVTGDNVTSLILADYSKNGKNELIVGSEDFEIRVFAEDEIITEITETEAVTALTPIQDGRFGYALANGTVGVYEKTTRWWRIKVNNGTVGVYEKTTRCMITGWSSGKLDARNDKSGEVVFKDNMGASIAGLTQGDYRQDGKMELIVSSTDGEVRGYLPAPPETKKNLMNLNVEQETIRELSSRKQNLLLELKNYETNQKNSGFLKLPAPVDEDGKIPAQTQLQTVLAINLGSEGKQPHVEVTLSTSNNTIIRAVLIFAEGIFEGESFVVHPKDFGKNISVPVSPPRDIPVDLHIKAFVGQANASQYHVFELTRQLPRFSMYSLVPSDDEVPEPEGELMLVLKERVQRIIMWLNQNFLLTEDLENSAAALDVKFLSLRDGAVLSINADGTGVVKIRTNNMDLAGDIVQSLANYLGLEDLGSTAKFPAEMFKLEGLLSRAEELQFVRLKLSADMADHSGVIRSLVVRGEDSRILKDMQSMKKWYGQLHDINRDLVSGYKIRVTNHEELMDTLKEVNQVIQRAGRLRIGKSKTLVINECRDAIKNKNISQLIKVISTGQS